MEALRERAFGALESVSQLDALEELRVQWLGKKGELTELMKSLGKLAGEDRPKAGAKANEVRDAITQRMDAMKSGLEEKSWAAKLASDRIDVTLPGRAFSLSVEHPITSTQEELVAIFERLGFLVEMGPEVEHEFYNFDALNMPPSHPARALQATFYIAGKQGKSVLRTHTSPVQIRTMLAQQPPVRMICPGRVYRADYDATHSPMFHQIEALLIDKDVQMGDLIGVLSTMVREFFGASLKVRLRPSFFPFTEPSAEIDIQCPFCKGKGCRTCKSSGWVEIGGSGMVDPEVFKFVKLNPEEYRGFAFGMGIERMAMLKYGIDDLRAFYESDQRFVTQFARWRP
jgi:phenylalanyl-tRNA synthetase alpha chain